MSLAYIHYKAGYKYQLTRQYEIHLPQLAGYSCRAKYFQLAEDGYLVIRAGYAWDGPSGPTIDTSDAMRASLVHDVLYQAMRLGLLPQHCRPIADDILRQLCLDDGMSRLRAWTWYRMVRAFAAPAAQPGHRRRELVAP